MGTFLLISIGILVDQFGHQFFNTADLVTDVADLGICTVGFSIACFIGAVIGDQHNN